MNSLVSPGVRRRAAGAAGIPGGVGGAGGVLRRGERLRLRLVGVTGLCVLLFSLLIALAYQPYDVAALRAFLLPASGCPSPCVMGVGLGTMPVEQALNTLEQHDWVGVLYSHLDGFYADWTWSGAQPDFITRQRIGFIGARSALNNVYNTVSVSTSITLGELVLALGRPDYSTFTRADRVRSRVMIHSVYYAALGLQADGLINCPITLPRLANTRLTLYWTPQAAAGGGDGTIPYTYPEYPRAWLNRLPLC